MKTSYKQAAVALVGVIMGIVPISTAFAGSYDYYRPITPPVYPTSYSYGYRTPEQIHAFFAKRQQLLYDYCTNDDSDQWHAPCHFINGQENHHSW